MPIIAVALCGFSPPERLQEWRFEAVEAVPGTITLYSYRTAYPESYLEEFTRPGPYPSPRITCLSERDLTLTIEWKYDRLPGRYSELEAFINSDLYGVSVQTNTLISDDRFSTVSIKKVPPRGFLVWAEFAGEKAVKLIKELWDTGVVPVTTFSDAGPLEWFLDFRAGGESIGKVLQFCGIDATSVLSKRAAE